MRFRLLFLPALCVDLHRDAEASGRAGAWLGAFFCESAAPRVLEWTGCYNFIEWKPVKRAEGHDRRFW